MSKRGLGRGFESLFGDLDVMEDESVQNTAKELPISQIRPNENQPRKVFDEAAMTELANSIRIYGVISPIIVVEQGFESYMIIAGERRFRAAQKAGLITIPAIVRNYNDQEIKEISLIENLQREDLNPIEIANAIKQLMEDYSYTQEQVADRIGKSRPAVANTLRLLSLSAPVVDLVAGGKLSEGHARCLVVVREPSLQLELAKRCLGDKMTVRDFEKLVKATLEPKPEKKPAPVQSLELRDMIARMQRLFATKVTAFGNDYKGRIYIDYFSRDDLDRIHSLIDSLEDKRSRS